MWEGEVPHPFTKTGLKGGTIASRSLKDGSYLGVVPDFPPFLGK